MLLSTRFFFLLSHKPWSNAGLYLQSDKGRLVSQDHGVTLFSEPELIFIQEWRNGKATIFQLLQKFFERAQKNNQNSTFALQFPNSSGIFFPCHYTISSTVWHTSVRMNVFTWVCLLLRSFALLWACPLTFQFTRILHFCGQVTWYPCRRVIPSGEASRWSSYKVWIKLRTQWGTHF